MAPLVSESKSALQSATLYDTLRILHTTSVMSFTFARRDRSVAARASLSGLTNTDTAPSRSPMSSMLRSGRSIHFFNRRAPGSDLSEGEEQRVGRLCLC